MSDDLLARLTEAAVEIGRLRSELAATRGALEWIVGNADPTKAPLIVGRARAALRFLTPHEREGK